MKATYKTNEGGGGIIRYEAIVPQPMQHTDGFTLLGFHSWEDVTDEKLAFAVTNVMEFAIDKKSAQVGFHNEEQS